MAQLGGRDEAVVVTVEDLYLELEFWGHYRRNAVLFGGRANLESLADLLLGVGILHLAGHHGQELWCRVSVRRTRLRRLNTKV